MNPLARIAAPLLAALSLLVAPAPAVAQSASKRSLSEKMAAVRDPSAALVGRWELEGGLGLAIPFENGLNTGFKLSGTGLYGQLTLGSGTLLQLGGTLAWTYNGYGSGVDGSVNAIDLLPLARLRFVINPQLFAFADGGMGLAIVHASISFPGVPPLLPATSRSSTDAALLVKLGGGLGFELQPNLALTLEPAFHFYAKSGSITQFTLLAGAVYRP
jgi:opacity protein-like surface antigen